MEGRGDLGVRFDPSTGPGHRRLNELRDGKVHEMQGGENSRIILYVVPKLNTRCSRIRFDPSQAQGPERIQGSGKGIQRYGLGGARLDRLQGGRYITRTLHRGGERQSRRGS